MLKKEDAIEHIKILMITEVLLLVGSNEKIPQQMMMMILVFVGS